MFGEAFGKSLDRMKESFLYAAAVGGNIEDCAQLLSMGANVNWRNGTGDTALLAACSRDHSDTVKLLLAHGAETHLRGGDFFAPIHVAVSKGSLSTLNHLLEANCEVNLMTSDGKTAMDIAQFYGYEHIVHRLEQHTRDMLKTDTHTSATAGILRSNTGVLPDAESSLSGTGYSLLRKSALPSLNNTVGDALSSSYTLMDSKFALLSACAPDTSTSSGTAGDCCDVFKKLFAQESSQRKALDKRIESYKLKVSTLSTQLDSSYKQISELEETVNRLNREMRYSKGDTIDEMSRANCEVLEREVRSLLERLEIRKMTLLEDEVCSVKSQRMCVVCQEREKTVVLMPCRHLCLCDVCGDAASSQVKACPLCRRQIVNKINVYA